MTAAKQVKRRLGPAKPAKKPLPRTIRGVEIVKSVGQEPDWATFETDENLGRALNFLNMALENDERAQEVLAYLRDQEHDEDTIAAVKSLPSYRLRTLGGLLYIKRRGAIFSNDHEARLDSILTELLASLDGPDSDEDVPVTKQTPAHPSFTVEERNRALTMEVYDIVHDGLFYQKGINLDEFKTAITGKPAKLVANVESKIKTLCEELSGIGVDEYVTESYPTTTKSRAKKMLAEVQTVLTHIKTHSQNVAAVRKPRKVKERLLTDYTKKLKYLKADASLDVVSISPEQMIGAVKVVVYNIKLRKLGVYHAAGPEGFSVKGTSLTGFDEKRSTQKTLRDLKDTPIKKSISHFRQSNSKNTDVLYEKLSTVATMMTGRLSEDVLILRVFAK